MSLEAIRTGSIGAIGHEGHKREHGLVYKIYEGLKIVFTDILPASLTCILPNAFSWAYRTMWTRSVQCHTLTVTADTITKAAYLFAHSVEKAERPNTPTSAILLLHGDDSHPLTMLHLADIAKSQGRTVFSVRLPYDNNNPEGHRSLLRDCIDKISQIVAQNGGSLSHLLLAGHSRGAMEAANEAFVKNNQKINCVIAIAGQFKAFEFNRNLRVPFYQIAAKNDWCMDPETSIVRRDHGHLCVDAGHLGVINHPETLKQFRTWVAV